MRCLQDYQCSSSPFTITVQTASMAGGEDVTLTVIPNPGANASSACYTDLSSTLQRIQIQACECPMAQPCG